jgi:hypothetical protein
MGKYDPISELLRNSRPPLTFTFAELDRLIGGLPRSARVHRSWWGNTHHPMHVHASAWVSVGWVVDELDLNVGRVTFVRGAVAERPRLSGLRRQVNATRSRLRNWDGPDGAAQLAAVLGRAGYASTMHAVAAHTSMLDPSVVAQTSGHAVFATVRLDTRRGERVGQFDETERVMFDDNLSPTLAFLWAAGHKRGTEMQFNHVWQTRRDRSVYTALWNVCMTPAFLAKTTDGSGHPEVRAALCRRAFDLYGHLPAGQGVPVAPPGYADLDWAPHPEPVIDLEAEYRRQMSTKPRNVVVGSARQFGWLFSAWQPDVTFWQGDSHSGPGEIFS